MSPSRNQRVRNVTSAAGALTAARLARSVTTHAVASNAPFPARVSANRRHLEDARGNPFLLHGDAAWSLIVQLTEDVTEEYLANALLRGRSRAPFIVPERV